MALPEALAGNPDASLEARFGHLDAAAAIAVAVECFAPSGLAVISSFGADAAVLLHLVAGVDRGLPVLFLETGKHFPETLAYRDALMADLGLTNVFSVAPYPHAIAERDSDGGLHARDPDACCALRKVEPMQRFLDGYAAWFTGRKRYQAGTREQLPVFEAVAGKVRINPLARWQPADIESYLRRHGLRRHPLVVKGYPSIGCAPCTRRVEAGADARSGRWAGLAKTECGIHFGPGGETRRGGEAGGDA